MSQIGRRSQALIPVQVIAWKDSSLKWPIVCRAWRKTLLTYSLAIYGELGHVPLDFQLFHISGHFRATKPWQNGPKYEHNVFTAQIFSPSRNLRRRPRVEWTESELSNLRDGVERYGHSWSTILRHYKFDPQRTTADLKEKNARLKKKEVRLVFFSTECGWLVSIAEKIQITDRLVTDLERFSREGKQLDLRRYEDWDAKEGEVCEEVFPA